MALTAAVLLVAGICFLTRMGAVRDEGPAVDHVSDVSMGGAATPIGLDALTGPALDHGSDIIEGETVIVPRDDEQETASDAAETLPQAASAAAETLPQAASAAAETLPQVYVHVCGEVNAPGVYAFDEGSRLVAAIEMAGGFTECADTDYWNLATVLVDGMKIEVPDREKAQILREQGDSAGGSLWGALGTGGSLTTGTSGGAGTPGSGDATAGATGASVPAKININTATKEQLMTLSGVGESRAGDIIRFREAHGAFGRIEDIMQVSGIKDALFGKIKDAICVD
jgi:competence protein ComEA